MPKTISSSVGQGGVNRNADVRTVQELLNKVPQTWGGPMLKLAEDGLIGPKTNAAIRRFQEVQFKQVFNPDGKVDPGKRTIGRLNEIADGSERPGANFRVSVEPISHVRQPSNMTCWAAAGTMLCAARDQMSMPIQVVMGRADANDPGYGYLNLFNTNQGLPPGDTGRYTRAIRLRVGPAASFSVQGWKNLMTNNGALGVVGLTPFLHIRVVSEMFGDGSVYGTSFTVHDPGTAAPYEELFINFANKYEDAANINHRMDQIWHK
ncbi:MAG: papain-like cysteine protease family protein [Bryobacterales bacterium]|nr:papain-like cysteine protease family protein [Bryobacterales bacterium]